ncbi:hypothetical protein HMSP1_36 [Sinorhizobium phage HMSP1-Susan]|nr:hypothetical protein HMSP1_36 [Sinorhizobium phage HMSP1-Susan]
MKNNAITVTVGLYPWRFRAAAALTVASWPWWFVTRRDPAPFITRLAKWCVYAR